MKLIIARYTGLAFVLFAALWSACTKSTPFGSQLLVNELADYTFTDSITLNVTLEREDSVLTSDRTSAGSLFLCGEVNDPVFGKTTSDIFTLFRTVNPALVLRSTDVVDSMVMFLRYRPGGVYGDTTQDQTLRVYRLDPGQQLQWGRDYYSDDEFTASEEIGVSEPFRPKPNTADTLFTVGSKAPFLRVKLNQAFANEMLTFDSTTQATDTLLWKALRGLKITAQASAAPGAMLAFDLNDRGYSVLRVYYTRGGTARTIDFEFYSGNKFTHFSHDYAGTPAGQRLGQTNPDLLFVQGAQGIRLKVELPFAARLPEDMVINKAQLQLTVASLPGDNPTLFPPAGQLILSEWRDTIFGPIPDLVYSLGATGTGGFGLFGGQPEKTLDNGVTVDRYLLTLSDYFQRALEDSTRNTMYLGVYPQASTVRRAVFYGPGSTTYPARVTLKFTRVQ